MDFHYKAHMGFPSYNANKFYRDELVVCIKLYCLCVVIYFLNAKKHAPILHHITFNYRIKCNFCIKCNIMLAMPYERNCPRTNNIGIDISKGELLIDLLLRFNFITC